MIGMALGMIVLAGGCARVREHRGYIVDEILVSSIQPGVDTRDSVQETLGRPTFTGQFDQRDWYYVSRNTRQLAFASPTPIAQTVLHVRFDETGNVSAVERTGMEKIVSVSPMEETTPTLGRNRGFFDELFGNIGTVGAGGIGGGGGDTGP
jgi:outer membrane protein assembly factor BamE (lipoprotein component of BamABCDE complex)